MQTKPRLKDKGIKLSKFINKPINYLVYIRENKISITQDISPVCWRVELRFYRIRLDRLNLLFRQYVDDCFAIFRSVNHVLCVRLSPFRTILTYNIEMCFVVA